MNKIRLAQQSDLESLCTIERNCFGPDAFTRRQIAYLISKAQGGSFVVESEEGLVGYISLLARPRFCDLRIYSIAVSPDARGGGVGQLLVDRALAFAREFGARSIVLEVNVTNEAAIALYHKNGFVEIQRIRGYYHDGGDAWRMRLRLTERTEGRTEERTEAETVAGDEPM